MHPLPESLSPNDAGAPQSAPQTHPKPSTQGEQQAQRLNRLESFYDGLDTIDQKLDPASRDQFQQMVGNTENGQESRAQSVNKVYLSYTQPQARDAIESQWPLVRQQAAKALGLDKPDVSDAELYGLIGSHVKQAQEHRFLAHGLIHDVQMAALEGNTDWTKTYQEFLANNELPTGPNAPMDSFRQMAEAASAAIAPRAAIIGPAVSKVSQILADVKADPNPMMTDEKVKMRDSLVDTIMSLPQEDRSFAIQLAATKVARETPAVDRSGSGGLEKAGEAFSRGVQNFTSGLSNQVEGAVSEMFAPSRNSAGPGVKEDLEQRRQVIREIYGAYNSTVDPVKGQNVATQGLLNISGMIPQLGLVANPVMGIPLLLASNKDARQGELISKGVPEDKASGIALAQGTVDTALQFVTGNMVFGKVSGMVSGAGAAPVAAAFMKNLGKEALVMSGVTAAQMAGPLIIQDLAANLIKSVPGVDWEKEMAGFKHALPETIATLVPMVLIGTGSATFREAAKFRDYTADVNNLKAVGFSEEQSAKIAGIADPLARLGLIKEEWSKRQPDPQVQAEAVAEVDAEVQRAKSLHERRAGINDTQSAYTFEQTEIPSNKTLGDMIGQPVEYAGYKGKLIRDSEGNFIVLREVVQKGQAHEIEVSGSGKDMASSAESLGVFPEGTKRAVVPQEPDQTPSASIARNADGTYTVSSKDGATKLEGITDPAEAQRLGGEVDRLNPPSDDLLPPPVDESSIKSYTGLGIVGNPDSASIIRVWESLSTTRRAFLAHVNRTAAKSEIAREFQAQENKATIFGRVNAEEIDNALGRAMERKKRNGTQGPAAEIDREALTFMREAQESRMKLQEWRNAIEESRNPTNPTAILEAKRALDHALANLERLAPVSQRYAIILDKHLAQQRDMGIKVGEREGYVPHWQDIDTGILNIFDSAGGSGTPGGYKHARTFPSYVDSILGGIKPKSIDAVTLLERRLASGQRSINRQLWATAARNVIDPTSLIPVVADMESGTREVDGQTLPDPTAPLGYVPMQIGGRTIAVQEGYTGLFRALQDPGAFQNSATGQAVMKGVQAAKSMALFFDTFHLGRVAMHQVVLRGSASYGKGLVLLDHSPAEITRMMDAGELGQVSPELRTEIMENKRKLDLLVDKGLNVATAFENLNADWVHNLPGIGAYNRWLFEKFQRGGMVQTGLIEFDRMKRMMPDASEEQVATRVATDINTRFGNLGAQSWIKSKTFRDLARVLFLAPGWNEGLLRSEIGAVRQLGETVKIAAFERRLVAGTLLRNVGGLLAGQFLANQVINYATRGKPTWENEEEGIGAKLSAWVPDAAGGPGFFLNPFSLPAEITHTLMKKVESGDSFTKAFAELLENKMSGIGRAGEMLFTRRDKNPDSGAAQMLKLAGFDPQMKHSLQSTPDMLKSMANAMIPLPIPTTPVVKAVQSLKSGETTQNRPGEIQSQLMQSAGIKTDSAPSAIARIYNLASEFKKENKIAPPPEVGDSDYTDIKHALTSGNRGNVADTMKELLTKRTPVQVSQYFHRYAAASFTGSRKHEVQFLATLSPEQKKTYEVAVKDRRVMATNAITALQQAEKPVTNN